MLYTIVLSEIYKTHMDPRIGYLYETNFRRFTLNLDISEIFKPIIVNRIIFKLLNENIINASNFKSIDNIVSITDNVYKKNYRIIIYHSKSLENKRKNKFMRHLAKAIIKAKKIIDSGDSDSMEKARMLLESEHLNETILLPSLESNNGRLDERISIIGKNALFTNISTGKKAAEFKLWMNFGIVKYSIIN